MLLEAAMDNSDDEDLNDPKNDYSSAEDQLMKGVYCQHTSLCEGSTASTVS